MTELIATKTVVNGFIRVVDDSSEVRVKMTTLQTVVKPGTTKALIKT